MSQETIVINFPAHVDQAERERLMGIAREAVDSAIGKSGAHVVDVPGRVEAP